MSAPADDFVELLAELQIGREQAWATVYEWLAPEVLGYLRARGTVEADDVVGATFLDVARSIDGFEGNRRQFRAWVFTIARARRVDSVRRAVRRTEHISEAVGAPEPVSSEGDPGQIADAAALSDRLEALTDDQREVVAMRVFGGFTSREIAEITDRTVGAVEQLYHRALTQLRKNNPEDP